MDDGVRQKTLVTLVFSTIHQGLQSNGMGRRLDLSAELTFRRRCKLWRRWEQVEGLRAYDVRADRRILEYPDERLSFYSLIGGGGGMATPT